MKHFAAILLASSAFAFVNGCSTEPEADSSRSTSLLHEDELGLRNGGVPACAALDKLTAKYSCTILTVKGNTVVGKSLRSLHLAFSCAADKMSNKKIGGDAKFNPDRGVPCVFRADGATCETKDDVTFTFKSVDGKLAGAKHVAYGKVGAKLEKLADCDAVESYGACVNFVDRNRFDCRDNFDRVSCVDKSGIKGDVSVDRVRGTGNSFVYFPDKTCEQAPQREAESDTAIKDAPVPSAKPLKLENDPKEEGTCGLPNQKFPDSLADCKETTRAGCAELQGYKFCPGSIAPRCRKEPDVVACIKGR